MATTGNPPNAFGDALGPFGDDAETPVRQTKPLIPPLIVPAATLQMRRMQAHANNYSHTRRTPRIIVIHATDGHEGPEKAEDCARMFQDANLKPRRTAHYTTDSNSAVNCVDDELIAWHCGKTGNRLGVGVEICGRASQSYEQWHDAESLATLGVAARLVAELCRRYSIPAVFLTSADLRAGRTGITTHEAVSNAWGESNHNDPGPNFPMYKFVEAVRSALGVQR